MDTWGKAQEEDALRMQQTNAIKNSELEQIKKK